MTKDRTTDRTERTRLGGLLLALALVTAAGTGLAAAPNDAGVDGLAPAAWPGPAVDAGTAAFGDVEGWTLTVPLRWVGGVGTHGQPIEGSPVTVTATAGDVTLTAEAVELKPGHAYTAWFFFWNAPERCVGHPNLPDTTLRCGGPDLFVADGNVLWGDGAVADADGRASFALARAAGECWVDPDQVAFPGLDGAPCLPGDASVPEYQVAVRDHGPHDPDAHGDAQTTTMNGGCEDYTCREPQSTGVAQQAVLRCFPPRPSADCLEGWVP